MSGSLDQPPWVFYGRCGRKERSKLWDDDEVVKKPGLTFHYPACLLGIITMVYYNAHITGYPTCTLTTRIFYCSDEVVKKKHWWIDLYLGVILCTSMPVGKVQGWVALLKHIILMVDGHCLPGVNNPSCIHMGFSWNVKFPRYFWAILIQIHLPPPKKNGKKFNEAMLIHFSKWPISYNL